MSRLAISEEDFLNRATEKVKENLNNPRFGVSELAREMGMSRSNLHRKIQKVVKISASRFIRKIRLEKAMELLRQTSLTVSEVSWETGFNSISYFIKCFREHYGFPPGEVGNRVESEDPGTPDQITSISGGKVWIIAGSILILVVLGYFAVRYFIYRPPTPAMNETPRAIAVLPFKNESTDSTNAYFINGLMESILMNLYNVPDLNVRSRTTVEKYRDSRKTLPEIARELHVNYIIEGSGQRYGDQVILNIQMLDAYSDKHLFSRQYNREIRNVEDFVELQSDIASNLVSEIKIEIEPEDAWPERTVYTSNFTAFQYYLRGLDLMIQGQGSVKQEDLDRRYRARDLFYRALELDPDFILPMVRLGWIYFGFSYAIPPPHNYLDSAFYFTRRAIQTDNSYGSTYGLLGRLYQRKGMFDKALENYRMAIRYGNDERSVNINRLLSSLYYEKGQYSKQVEYLYKQLHLEIEDQTDAEYWTLHHLFTSLNNLGFKKVSRKFSDWIFQQDKDSVKYLERQILNHFVHAHFDSVLMVNKERRKLDSLYVYWPVPWTYLLFKEYETALNLFHRHAEQLHFESADLGPAIIYRHMGQTKEADSILVKAIDQYQQAIERYRGTNAAAISIIRLAGAYAVIGEQKKSIETLRRNKNYRLRMIGMVKYNPMFDPVRDEPEFQEIMEQMQEKYRSERQKTAELLTELGEI